MIPVTDAMYARNVSVSDPRYGASLFERLASAIVRWAEDVSREGTVAYVEAEYFGNAGGQRAVVWKNGKQSTPIENHAINEALRLLGVSCIGNDDEFDSVGLGRFRHTEQWVKSA